MDILVKRIFSTSPIDKSGTGYTISHLYINGKQFCDILEDVDRGLDNTKSEEENKRLKIQGKTAIPVGKYNVLMNIISNRFSKQDFYQQYGNGGRLPRLEKVKAFDGVLIHSGNKSEHSEGCLLCGENKVKGQVINSKETFKKLYNELSRANKAGEAITLTITRTYKR